jgi:hypothetical protein
MIDALFGQHGTMTVRCVSAQTGVYPQAQTGSKLTTDLRDHTSFKLMREFLLGLVTGHRKEQKMRDAILQIILDLSQCGCSTEADVTTQARNRFIALQTFNHKKRLNQLRAIKLSFRAQVA